MESIKSGQIVRFAKALEPGDESSRFEVLWVDGPRAMLRLVCELPIAPTQIVLVTDVVAAL